MRRECRNRYPHCGPLCVSEAADTQQKLDSSFSSQVHDDTTWFEAHSCAQGFYMDCIMRECFFTAHWTPASRAFCVDCIIAHRMLTFQKHGVSTVLVCHKMLLLRRCTCLSPPGNALDTLAKLVSCRIPVLTPWKLESCKSHTF